MKLHRIFFFLLIIFLPTQLGYHFWPDWTLVLGRRVDYLSPTVYLTDVLLVATLLFWFKESVSRIKNHELRIKKKPTQWYSFIIHNSLFIILTISFVAVNVFVATSKPIAFYKWIKVLEFAALGWYILKTKPSVSLITFCLSLAVFYSSILAITQFFLQHSIGGPLWFLGERTFTIDTPGIARINWCQVSSIRCQEFLRPYATFPHPNVLGGFLAVTLPLIIYELTKRRKIFYLLTIGFGLVALLLTFSRSAIVVGLIAIAYTIARIKNYELRIKNYIYLTFLFIIILTSYFLLHNSPEESVVVREQLNSAAVKIFSRSPLIGVGAGNFLIELPKVLPSRAVYFLQPVHNIYLLLLSEVGLVGTGIVGWLIFSIIKKYELRSKNYGQKQNTQIFILHTSLFIILLIGLVDHYPLTLQQGQLLLTIYLALSIHNS